MKTRTKPGYITIQVPDKSLTPEQRDELESQAMDEVASSLGVFPLWKGEDPMQAGICRVKEFSDYFPGANKLPEEGAWIMVTDPPCTEYTVPPLSMWFASPWPQDGHRGHTIHRVKIVTPRGELGLFPREYSHIKDVGEYFPHIGNGELEIKFFGGIEGVPADALFYLRSRGISKADAITMLLGQIKSHGVCWIQAAPEICAAFGMKWPSEDRLATVQ